MTIFKVWLQEEEDELEEEGLFEEGPELEEKEKLKKELEELGEFGLDEELEEESEEEGLGEEDEDW